MKGIQEFFVSTNATFITTTMTFKLEVLPKKQTNKQKLKSTLGKDLLRLKDIIGLYLKLHLSKID